MLKYLVVARLATFEIFEYRLDFFLRTAKYAMMVVLMALVWIAVKESGAETNFSTQETVSYFFYAAMLYSLSNFHPYYIEDDIRLGALSKYLLKPVMPFAYYFAYAISLITLETVTKIVIMIPALLIFGYTLSFNPSSLLLMILYAPLIFLYAFHQFGIISGLSFWIHEAWAVRWTLSIIFRFLAGILVPISFFPNWAQSVSYYLPFQHLAYTPILLLQEKITTLEALKGFGILAIWTLVVIILRHWQWQRGYIRYEASGQ